MTAFLALLEAVSIIAALCLTTAHLATGSYITLPFMQAGLLSLCWIVVFYYADLYELREVRSFSQFLDRFPMAAGIALIVTSLVLALVPALRMPLDLMASSLLLIPGLIMPVRAAWYEAMTRHPLLERVLLLGATPLARTLIEELEARPHCAVIGVVDDAITAPWFPRRYPLLGPLGHLDRIVEKVRPDRIIVAITERQRKLPVQQLLMSRVRGILVEDGLEVYERLTGKLAIESLTTSSLVFSKEFKKSRFHQAVGRAVSLFVSVIGLVGCAPLFALIVLAIKLDSPGPVFFIQDRIGMNGRRFQLFKFRTMHPASGKTSEWVRDNGERITRVGRWLRKFRLDELPQFMNILRGEMNLVGPRPHPASNHDLLVLVSRNVPECGEPIPYYTLRSMVRPGVTGWAQVRYRYANDIEEEIEKMRYDLYYIKHMSVWFDLRILFETVKIVLAGSRSGATAADHAIATSKGEPTTPIFALPGHRWAYRTRHTTPAIRHDNEHQQAS
jgi:exopolysaccharide biosynthesis polyprenyl glycosylphosphotransferase